jgi:hypothetical protein
MTQIEYLEAHKIELLASQYQNSGYQVVVSPLEIEEDFKIKPLPYHLTATNRHYKLAFEVVERGELADERLDRLSTQADREQFNDFRLAIVNPPAETKAEITGLEQQLFSYLVINIPDHLAELPAQVRLESVGQVGFEEISVMFDRLKVIGNGVVVVELQNGYHKQEDQFNWEFGFPISFDVELDHALRLKAVHHLTADTSSFYERLEALNNGGE